MFFCVHKHYKQISYLVSAPHTYKIYGPGGTADHISHVMYILCFFVAYIAEKIAQATSQAHRPPFLG